MAGPHRRDTTLVIMVEISEPGKYAFINANCASASASLAPAGPPAYRITTCRHGLTRPYALLCYKTGTLQWTRLNRTYTINKSGRQLRQRIQDTRSTDATHLSNTTHASLLFLVSSKRQLTGQMLLIITPNHYEVEATRTGKAKDTSLVAMQC